MKHLDRMLEALHRRKESNTQLAIDEPANDFEKAVNEWQELQQLHEMVKDIIKPLAEAERKSREALAGSLHQFFIDKGDLTEGVNNYELSNGRKLKYTYGVDRKIETPEVANTRKEYKAQAQPSDPAFDDLLRVKYELEIKPYRKLSEGALKAVSRMVTSKAKASVLEVN